MLNGVSQFCQDYYDQLPTDGLKAVGLSAVFSFVASVIVITLTTPPNQIPNNMSRAGAAAGLAFLAATIHAVTTPIFNYLFDNPNNTFNGCQEFVRTCVDITLVHLLINHLTAFKINLITSVYPSGQNFIMIPHTIFKMGIDMGLRGLCFANILTPPLAARLLNYFGNSLHIDFNQNSSPIYVAV